MIPSVLAAANLSFQVLAVCAGCAAAAVIGSLKVLAAWVQQEQQVHDLKVRTHKLRLMLTKQMAQREGLIPYDDQDGEVIYAEPVEDPGTEVSATAPTAGTITPETGESEETDTAAQAA